VLVGAIHHVNLVVDDVGAAVGFYRDLLGLTVLDRPDFGMDGAWLAAGATQVHLSTGTPPPADALQHFAFAVADLSAVVARLRDAGVDVFEVPHTAGAGHQAFARDPAGNLVEFNQADRLPTG
jgi:catechol 2,3-dioxygenase-like lactoylglutathione lyase family enzyme